MKIHNLLKHPDILPKGGGYHDESEDVYLVYRILTRDENNKWCFQMGFGRGFYSHEEKLWYGYFNDEKSRIDDLFDEDGGQEWEDIDYLIEDEVPECIIAQLTPVPKDFAYHHIGDDVYFTTEIVGWFEMPTWEEFKEED